MKNLFILMAFGIFFMGCQKPYIFNRVVEKSDGDKMLLGGAEIEAFKKEPFSEWFVPNYDAYQPDQEKIKEIKSKIKGFRIEAYVGTWCDDTHDQYPKFIKILNEADFPDQRLLTYAVNENLKSFYGEEIGKNIHHVPTFIFYKGGKEVGRIVETPVSESLEQDILMIVNGTPQNPNYFLQRWEGGKHQ